MKPKAYKNTIKTSYFKIIIKKNIKTFYGTFDTDNGTKK